MPKIKFKLKRIGLRKLKKQSIPFFIGLLLVGIPVIFLAINKRATVEAAWWTNQASGTSWGQRKQLTLINSSTAPLSSGTTIAITVDTKSLANQGLLKTDCSDLRIVYQPNSTTFTELTRHIVTSGNVTCNLSNATKVYFKLQASLAGYASTPSTYYMYYDNPKATVPTGTESVFNIGSKVATVVCLYDGTTACATGETNSAATPGLLRFSGDKSTLLFDGVNDYVAISGVDGAALISDTVTQQDSTTHASNTYSSTLTWSHTVSASNANTQLVVGVAVGGNFPSGTSITSITYNGQNLTKLGSSGPRMTAEIWALQNPPTGTHDIVITLPESVYSIMAGANNWINVDSVTPFGTYTHDENSVIPQVSYIVPSNPNGVVVDVVSTTRNEPTAVETAQWSDPRLEYPDYGAGSSKASIGMSTTMTWNFNPGSGWEYALAGIGLNPANVEYTPENGTIHTVEMWVLPSSTATPLFDIGNTITASIVNGNITVANMAGSTVYVNGVNTTAISANTWSHVAITSSTAFGVPSANFGKIGSTYFKGQMDEIRVSTVMRYNGNFTPQTSAFVRDEYTKLLYHFNENGSDPHNNLAMDDSDYRNNGGIAGAVYTHGLPAMDGSNVNQGSAGTGGFAGHPGVFVEEGTVNNIPEPSFEMTPSYWQFSSTNCTNGDETSIVKFGSHSRRVTATSSDDVGAGIYLDTGTDTQTLSAYVYRGTAGNSGGTVDATVAGLVFNGAAQTTNYINEGGGWWRLTYTGTPAGGSQLYGIALYENSGTIYIDGVQLENLTRGADAGESHATSYIDGSLGEGYSWSGTPHYSTSTREAGMISYPTASNISASQGTVSMWIKPPYNTVAGPWGFSSFYFDTQLADNDYIHAVTISLQDTGHLYCRHNTQDIDLGLISVYDRWINVAVSWNGNSIACYRDGALIGSGDGGEAVVVGSDFGVGYGDNWGGAIIGDSTISDFRAYDSVLTATEVSDLYNAQLVSYSQGAAIDKFSDAKGQNPLAIYHFSEGSGTTSADSSAYGNHLTVSGASWNTSGNYSLIFDGSNDYAYHGEDADFNPGTSPFTISGLMKYSSTAPSSGTRVLVSRYGSAGYKIYMNSSGYLCFGIDADSTWSPADEACSTTSYADSKWHTFSAVKTSTPSILLYVDGNQVGSDTSLSAISSLNTVSRFYIGIDSNGTSNPWPGGIDELYIYPYARSADQVKADLNNPQVKTVVGQQAEDNLSEGLVGYWKFDEASGTLADASGNGNTGTWNGGGTHYGQAKFGNGAVYTASDWINAGNSPSLHMDQSKSMTFSTWVYFNSFASDTTYKLLRYDDYDTTDGDGVDNGAYHFGVYSGTNANAMGNFWYRGSGQATSGTLTDSIINPGQWYHLAATRDAVTKEIKYYINGQLKGTGTDTQTGNWETTGQYLMIGGWGGTYLNGKMDESRIYNRALSSNEITQLYKYAPGPVIHYTFNEDTLRDSSGNNQVIDVAPNVSSDDYVTGIYGKALDFKGESYIVIDDSPSLRITGSMTASTWFNLHETPGEFDYMILFNKNWDDFDINYTIRKDAYRNFYFSFNGANSGCDFTTEFTKDNWYYVTAAFDDENNVINLYVNGILDNTCAETGTPIASSDAPLVIGSFNNGWAGYGTFFPGVMDDFKIYNYARSPQQIIEDMNAGHPAPGSPVNSAAGLWDFDEGYGDKIHNKGYGGIEADGTFPAAPENPTWTNDGRFGKALYFDGGDIVDLQNYNSGPLYLTDAITLAAWVKLPVTVGGGEQMIIGRDALGQESYDLRISDGKAEMLLDGSTAAISTTTLLPNVWYHVAGTWDPDDSGKITIYVNGKAEGTAYSATSGGSWCGITLGATSQSLDSFTGTMDDVRMYSSALSADQIRELYNQGTTLALGSLSGTSSTLASPTSPNAASNLYCVPGDTTNTCRSPIAEWRFDEGNGDSAYDTSGNNNTATFHNGIGWTSGKVGKAAKFEGGTEYASVASSSFYQMTNNFSYEVWVKRTSDANVELDIFSTQDNWIDMHLRNFHDISVRVRYTDWGGDFWGCSNWEDGIAPLNQWTHYATTMDSNTLKIYKNGQLCNSVTISKTIGPGTPVFTIGAYGPAGNLPFIGSMDNLTVYNYARTPAQIAWDYNKGAPVAFYKFDECSGTTLYDSAPKPDRGYTPYNATITPGSSGNTAVGTCNSGVTTDMWNDGTTGKYNSSLGFDGTDDYASLTNDINVAGWTSISYGGWFNLSGYPNNFNVVVGKFDPNDSGFGSTAFLLWVDQTGHLNSQVQPDNDYTHEDITGTAVLNTGQWYYAFVTWDGTTEKLYLDGKLIGSVTTGGNGYLNNTQTTYIGSASVNPTSSYFYGLLDDLRIYSYALTDSQVKALYNNGAVSFE